MLPFPLVHSDRYYLPIGEHVFPANKYRLLYRRLLEERLTSTEDVIEPAPADDADVLLVHTAEYVRKLKSGTLSSEEELQLEVPFSPELVEAFWLSAGGSILAGRLALEKRAAFNLCGGFHHAYPDHGEGFCMIHDVAIALRRLLQDGKIRRAMTLDCDVHHGNGTAAIFGVPGAPSRLLESRPSGTMTAGPVREVFTISLHQQNNYPALKPPSSLDVNLADRTADESYLEWLEMALIYALKHFEPELLCYIAGADPYREDQLGGLGLSLEGLRRRDEFVFQTTRAQALPVMVTFAGGYARRLEDTITIHANTVQAAASVYGGIGS